MPITGRLRTCPVNEVCPSSVAVDICPAGIPRARQLCADGDEVRCQSCYAFRRSMVRRNIYNTHAERLGSVATRRHRPSFAPPDLVDRIGDQREVMNDLP
jgi:hypothetical protein